MNNSNDSPPFQTFAQIIPEHKKKALGRIYEVLDEKVIRQQAQRKTLNFKSFSILIIQWLADICAPIQDDDVNDLHEINDVVLTYRRILEVMDRMKLDKANFYSDAVRKEVVSYSVEYEKLKFNEFLKTQQGEWELWSMK